MGQLEPVLVRFLSYVVVALGIAFSAQAAEDKMHVHFIDVGQGAATLIEFPCAAVLIDTGGEDEAVTGFHSTPRLEAYLDKFFARRSDLKSTLALLAITHPHIDHARGAAMVMAKYKVLNVVDNGWSRGHDSGTDEQHALDQAAAQKHLGYEAITHSVVYDPHDSVLDPVACSERDPKIQALWGRVDPAEAIWEAGYNNANNNSVVFRIDYGMASIVITGDLEKGGITEFLQKYKGTGILDADIYEVGHHGSHNATTRALLKALTPKIAVMAVGTKDRGGKWVASNYGHPRKVIIDMLQGTGDSVGAVTMDRMAPITVPVTAAMQRKQAPSGKKYYGPQWVDVTLTRAIYATAWDGNLVIDAAPDGTYAVRLHQ